DLLTEFRQAKTAAVMFDVSSRGKVEVAGPDAARFLHNLSSNDVLHLAPGTGCEAFLTTAKAKGVAHLWVWHLPAADGRDACGLDLAPGMAPKVIQHLDYYLISEQVELPDQTAAFSQYHVAGPRAAEVLAGIAPDLPPLHAAQLPHGGQVRRCNTLGVQG